MSRFCIAALASKLRVFLLAEEMGSCFAEYRQVEYLIHLYRLKIKMI